MNDTDEDRTAIDALISDLHWQVDQLRERGIKDKAGNPYNPSYYKRGLQDAINRGGRAVPDFVLGYVHRPPSGGYKKLEEADSLDLACETLVADATKPYAHLFTDEDRAAARKRLAPHIAAIEARKGRSRKRVASALASLPDDLDALRLLADAAQDDPERAVAVNTAIAEKAPDEVPAFIRLGRAHEALGDLDAAIGAYERALEVQADNPIATNRLREAVRRRGRLGRTPPAAN